MYDPKEPGDPHEDGSPFWGDGGDGRAPGSWRSPGLDSGLQGGERVWPPTGFSGLRNSAGYLLSCSEEREIFHSQRSAEKYSGLPRRLRSLTGTGAGGQQQAPGKGGSWAAPSSMDGVGQGLPLSPQFCLCYRVSDPGTSAPDVASHLFGSLHAPADHPGSR